MASTLHILNGDDTLQKFEDTGLDGDVLVWREVLSEGPLAAKPDRDFWQARSQWINRTFEDTPERYQELVIQELGKLNEPYEEVNLWFEYDLHCQVNLLGVMQLLQQQTDLTERTVNLICPGSYPGIESFKGMGELEASQLEDLYDNRVQLTGYDFTLAAQAWQAYITNDASILQQWLQQVPFWGSMPLLQAALQAQVKRLQVNENGLGYIEQKLLHLYQHGIQARSDIYKAFGNEAPIYGMGNMELDIYLKSLESKGLVNLGNV